MKFLPLDVDCISVCPNPLNSSRPAHAGVKEVYPVKSGYFTVIGWSSVKTVADKHIHAAYHNKHWH